MEADLRVQLACAFLGRCVVEGASTAVFSHCPLVARQRIGYYPSGAKATPPLARFTNPPSPHYS